MSAPMATARTRGSACPPRRVLHPPPIPGSPRRRTSAAARLARPGLTPASTQGRGRVLGALVVLVTPHVAVGVLAAGAVQSVRGAEPVGLAHLGVDAHEGLAHLAGVLRGGFPGCHQPRAEKQCGDPHRQPLLRPERPSSHHPSPLLIARCFPSPCARSRDYKTRKVRRSAYGAGATPSAGCASSPKNHTRDTQYV